MLFIIFLIIKIHLQEKIWKYFQVPRPYNNFFNHPMGYHTNLRKLLYLVIIITTTEINKAVVLPNRDSGYNFLHEIKVELSINLNFQKNNEKWAVCLFMIIIVTIIVTIIKFFNVKYLFLYNKCNLKFYINIF
jgi:hypothetical protein